nr:hypothetical protein Iba_chr06aCG14750 [Ipomoea batatas]
MIKDHWLRKPFWDFLEEISHRNLLWGEDDSNDDVDSVRRDDHHISLEPQLSQRVQANVQSSTLLQEPAQTDEVARTNFVKVNVESQPATGEEAKSLPTSTANYSMQMNTDAELARQLAHEELLDAPILPYDNLEEISRERILRDELRCMYDWQKWSISNLEILAETMAFIKGKGRGVNDDIPEDRARADKGLLEKVKFISRFQSTFRDSHPGVGTSGPKDRTDDPTSEQDDSAEGTEEVHTSSGAEAELSGNPITRLDNALDKEALDHAEDSIESSSSNDSGDEAHGQEQTTAQRSSIPTSTPPEIEVSRRVEEEINLEHTENISQHTEQEVDQSNHSSISPREVEEPRTVVQAELALVTIDSRAKVNTQATPSSARDGNQKASRGVNHDDVAPSKQEQEELESPNPRQIIDTALHSFYTPEIHNPCFRISQPLTFSPLQELRPQLKRSQPLTPLRDSESHTLTLSNLTSHRTLLSLSISHLDASPKALNQSLHRCLLRLCLTGEAATASPILTLSHFVAPSPLHFDSSRLRLWLSGFLFEATKNYLELKVSKKFAKLIENKSIREARTIINDEIDRSDLVVKDNIEYLNK